MAHKAQTHSHNASANHSGHSVFSENSRKPQHRKCKNIVDEYARHKRHRSKPPAEQPVRTALNELYQSKHKRCRKTVCHTSFDAEDNYRQHRQQSDRSAPRQMNDLDKAKHGRKRNHHRSLNKCKYLFVFHLKNLR